MPSQHIFFVVSNARVRQVLDLIRGVCRQVYQGNNEWAMPDLRIHCAGMEGTYSSEAAKMIREICQKRWAKMKIMVYVYNIGQYCNYNS